MAFDRRSQRRNRQEERDLLAAGGDADDFKPDKGETHLIYLAQIPYPPDPVTGAEGDIDWLLWRKHAGISKYGEICIGESNDDLWLPGVQEALGKRKVPLIINVEDGCPGCERLDEEAENYDPDEAERLRFEKDRALAVVIPWFKKIDGKFRELPESKKIPRPLEASSMMREQIQGALDSVEDRLGIGVSDLDGAILLEIHVDPDGTISKYYKVTADVKTLDSASRLVLPVPQRKLLKRFFDSGQLYRRYGRFVKDRKTLAGMIGGDRVQQEREPQDPDKPGCFGSKSEYGDEDEYCQKCDFQVGCREKIGIAPPKREAPPAPKAKEAAPQEPAEEKAEEAPPVEKPAGKEMTAEEAALAAFTDTIPS